MEAWPGTGGCWPRCSWRRTVSPPRASAPTRTGSAKTRSHTPWSAILEEGRADERLVRTARYGARHVEQLLLIRNRLEMTNYPPLSAERRDTLLDTPDGLRLARREILIDQAMVMMPNLAIFL